MVRNPCMGMPDEPSNGANRFLTRKVFRSSVGEGSFWGSGHLRTKNNIRRKIPQRESLGPSNVVHSSWGALSSGRNDISSSDLPKQGGRR